MQQIVGVNVQRYDVQSLTLPERGPNQHQLPEEIITQEWRDEQLEPLRLYIFQILLPNPTKCQFWLDTLDFIHSFGNGPVLNHLPFVPMPFYNNDALLPLLTTPQAGVCSGLSRYAEIVEDVPKLEDVKDVLLPLRG